MNGDKIAGILREYRRFIIAGHVNPDGDAIGACMALAMVLEKMNKEPVVLLEGYPFKYDVIPGKRFLWREGTDTPEADVFIALDCGDIERLETSKPFFDQTPITICIDHHETNTGFAQYNLIDVHASSTCEMVYDLIESLVEMDADIAAALYAGMVTDTGGFRFNASTKATMEKAARLMDTGIRFTDIYNALLHDHTFTSLKALGIAFENMRKSTDGKIVYSGVTRAEMDKINAVPSDLDGVAKYLIRVQGAEVAFFVYEGDAPNEVKGGLRSNGLHVGKVGTRWGGGGHRLAAGFKTNIPIAELIPRLLKDIEGELSARD
ncbi:MAG: bifunctional oligoribonuclease/PAP phosphatase NrnA [Defluviitaleaceae bacterium]|nr:bifunctional oligoribonuclease/PAP phosphatase NrnA [Defluviitaleaceae bacterium]